MTKIAITLPTYRGQDWLKNVSIPSVLKQTHEDWHLFIVNDSIHDEDFMKTLEAVESFSDPRITFSGIGRNFYRNFQEEDGEIGGDLWNIAGVPAINKSLSLISEYDFDYIAHIDQDDFWLPNHLETLIEKMRKSEADLVYAKSRHYLNNNFMSSLGQPFHREGFLNGNFIAHSSIMYRPDAPHDYYYSMEPDEPADYKHMKSFFKYDGAKDFVDTGLETVLYFQKCSLEFAKKEIKKYA